MCRRRPARMLRAARRPAARRRYETTANVLTWALYCLAVMPGVQDGIVEELHAAGDDDYWKTV